ncbi:MAG TPA: hypothetical protein VEL07_14305 [Planctomycetota bacterium]|nr:hypothetical protein [Planctomycetota bacterium]
MAVDGLPDPKRHAICRKCMQWFDRTAGDLIWPPVNGLMSFVRVRAGKIADADKLMQFWCTGCQQRQAERNRKSKISAVIAIAVVAVVGAALWYTGTLAEIMRGFSPR